MLDENKQVIKDIVSALRHFFRAAYLDNAKISRQYGVTGAQAGVLRTIRDAGPASSAQLSRILYVTPSTMTGLIDRLEIKGLVVRNKKAGDRRVSIISLTEEGKELSQELPDPLELKLVSALADLDPSYVKNVSTVANELLSMLAPPPAVESPTVDTMVGQVIDAENVHQD
jgi:DNA-binding MarR family transcriptional regulator